MEFWADVVPRREQFGSGNLTWSLGDRSFNGRERNCAFRNMGGMRFEDVAWTTGVDGVEDARGAVVADLDGDGAPDIVVNNWRQPVRLWRHQGVVGRQWCTVRLRGSTQGNREAIGATVTCRGKGLPTQALPITAGTGFLSQVPAEACFGLGEAESCTVTVRWPDGAKTSHSGLGPGRWEIDQATGKARRLDAPAKGD